MYVLTAGIQHIHVYELLQHELDSFWEMNLSFLNLYFPLCSFVRKKHVSIILGDPGNLGVKDLTPTTHSMNIYIHMILYIHIQWIYTYTYTIIQSYTYYYIYTHITCIYCLQLSCGTQWFTMPGLMFLLMFNPNNVHKIDSTVDLQGYIQQTFPTHLRSYFENQSQNVLPTRVPPIPALQPFQTHGCWIPVSKS